MYFGNVRNCNFELIDKIESDLKKLIPNIDINLKVVFSHSPDDNGNGYTFKAHLFLINNKYYIGNSKKLVKVNNVK